MSNLPCEVLDHIVDLLHDSKIPLRNCCLVSKSWVARTRTHLFAEVIFQTAGSLELWKKRFPDPSTSPARYTKALLIGDPKVVTAVDVEANSWIGGFSRVVRLAMVGQGRYSLEWGATFTQFRGFSPFVKSLRVKHTAFPLPRLSDLIHSFPLLEDLSVIDCYRMHDDGNEFDGASIAIRLSNLPISIRLAFLLLCVIDYITRWLLSLTGSIRLWELFLMLRCEGDISPTIALAEKCSHTLETIGITFNDSYGHPMSVSLNISKATKLRDAVFRPGSLRVKWITRTLRVIMRKHRGLRRISVDVPYHLAQLHLSEDLRRVIEEEVLEQWLDLDHALVRLWDLLSIHTDVVLTRGRVEGVLGDFVGCLLPEMTRRGMVTVNLVE